MWKISVSNVGSQAILHNTTHTSDAMNAMNTDRLSWTALTKYHLPGHQHHTLRHTEVIITGPLQGSTTKTEEEETDPNLSQDTAGITAQATIDLTEITQGHKDGTEITTTEAVQGAHTQQTGDAVTCHAVTHHISHIIDDPHITALWVIDPEIIAGHTCDHPTNLQGMNHANQVHTPAGQEEGHTPRRT